MTVKLLLQKSQKKLTEKCIHGKPKNHSPLTTILIFHGKSYTQTLMGKFQYIPSFQQERSSRPFGTERDLHVLRATILRRSRGTKADQEGNDEEDEKTRERNPNPRSKTDLHFYLLLWSKLDRSCCDRISHRLNEDEAVSFHGSKKRNPRVLGFLFLRLV